jgi:D-glycero-D-manno-heptose 1,7-bisphosphate phosphatase
MARAVFLDRDGVVIRAMIRGGKPYPPETLEQLELVAGAEQMLSRLHLANYLLILITNQPDVARGSQDRGTVEAINSYLSNRLPIDDCLVCYHDDRDGCDCRKPRPGLILRAAELYSIDLEKSFLIGDRWRDIDAGYAAGCRTVLINRGYQERGPANAPDACVSDLRDAVEWILIQPEESSRNSLPGTQ